MDPGDVSRVRGAAAVAFIGERLAAPLEYEGDGTRRAALRFLVAARGTGEGRGRRIRLKIGGIEAEVAGGEPKVGKSRLGERGGALAEGPEALRLHVLTGERWAHPAREYVDRGHVGRREVGETSEGHELRAEISPIPAARAGSEDDGHPRGVIARVDLNAGTGAAS
eukprot:4481005-Prymnesium_polylepis.1